MKDMMARLATHQTTPISTCSQDEEDVDGLEHEEEDEEKGEDEDGVCLSLFFLIVNLRIQNCISYQQF